ncbi:hypothetical protein IKG20_01455 [Candidatus Saccharibacteria bacterium]|nr:hypothetical protein [Candidatus Saccharibacteria bacterium]
MGEKSLSLKKCREIVNRVNGTKVNSFSGLNRAMSIIPGIETLETEDKTGVLTILATLFDTSELADASLDLPRQTPAQTITLEAKFPYNERCDYSVGFRLGDKFAEVGHGWFSNIVKAG